MLSESLDIGFSNSGRILDSIYWSKPSNDFWLRDAGSVEFISEIRRHISKVSKKRPDVNLIVNNRFENHRKLNRRLRLGNNHHIFDKAYAMNLSPEMASCEVFIVPGCFAAINFYYWKPGYDLPIPIGFITRDKARVDVVSGWAVKEWFGFGRKVNEVWCARKDPKAERNIAIDPAIPHAELSQPMGKGSKAKARSTLKLGKKSD
jgi:hypothetical protein